MAFVVVPPLVAAIGCGGGDSRNDGPEPAAPSHDSAGHTHDPPASSPPPVPAIPAPSQTTTGEERTLGKWTFAASWPVSGVNTHLLRDGTVLTFSEYVDGSQQYVWDPSTDTTRLATAIGYNAFCAGAAFLGDGTLLVAGGHQDHDTGVPFARIYDAATGAWRVLPDMNMGRWYPSVTTLANGDAIVLSGWLTDGVYDPLPQVWERATGRWRDLSGAQEVLPLYPRAFLAPDGRVFVAGSDQLARWIDTDGAGTRTDGPLSTYGTRSYGTAVMYRAGRILVVGGDDPPTATAEIIDLAAAQPAWSRAASMSSPRRQLNATALPDGTVLVIGGSSGPGMDDGTAPVLHAEVWDPDADVWTTLAAGSVYRGYHSTALLLPDGRVLVAGGRVPGQATLVTEKRVEIFSPPYLFRGPRPEIASAPKQIAPGDTFTVLTRQAPRISKVTLVRTGAVTHAFDMNQRLLVLDFSARDASLTVTAPATNNLAPPGDYLLFVVDVDGVPSVGSFVRVAVR